MALTGLVAANNLNDVVDVEKVWDNIGDNISATAFVPAPSLDLNFASNKSLIDSVSGNNLITFTRASSGTFVGSNGLIQAAASGVPRFDHNPATGESLGLLVEEARTNLLTYSEQFDNAAWFKSYVTITLNAAVAPDGTSTADLLTANSGSSPGGDLQNATVTPALTTYSIYVKKQIARYCGFTSWGYFGGNVYFDLDTGLVVPGWGFHPTFGTVVPAITNAGNGWYRISISSTTDSKSLFRLFVSTISGTSANNPPTGDGVSGIYVWGGQAEAGAFSTSYIPTTSSTVTRAADIASITGTNFSSWWNPNAGSIIMGIRHSIPDNNITYVPLLLKGNTTYDRLEVQVDNNGIAVAALRGIQYENNVVYPFSWSFDNTINALPNTNVRFGMALSPSSWAFSANTGSLKTGSSILLPTGGQIWMMRNILGNPMTGTIARLAYYPVRLTDSTLQALSTYGVVSSFPYSFSIKGKDILALKQVNRASTRDFIFIKGLTSNAQARITTASQYTASGVALRNAAMLKVAPTTSGNYFFSSGFTLSGATVQINGTNALSIATSPFSGSTATAPLLFAGLRPQANWRFSEAMTSGTITSPESAIPIDTNDFLLFIKAGQG